ICFASRGLGVRVPLPPPRKKVGTDFQFRPFLLNILSFVSYRQKCVPDLGATDGILKDRWCDACCRVLVTLLDEGVHGCWCLGVLIPRPFHGPLASWQSHSAV